MASDVKANMLEHTKPSSNKISGFDHMATHEVFVSTFARKCMIVHNSHTLEPNTSKRRQLLEHKNYS
uniref:Ovule protein n=1 Tax=Heterorhabditis bacteriophora TaxID=37862 RepID=A0A1I7WIZ0_HETBA